MRSIKQMVIEKIYVNIWNNSHSQEEYISKYNWAKRLYEDNYEGNMTSNVRDIIKKYRCDKHTAIDLEAARMSDYIEYLAGKGWIKW